MTARCAAPWTPSGGAASTPPDILQRKLCEETMRHTQQGAMKKLARHGAPV